MINSKNLPLTGARAKIFIKFNGGLKSLAKKISEDLHLPEFNLKSDMDPPHTISAMCECLGFETWLYTTKKIGNYCFEFSSIMCKKVKIDNDHMNDISEWFARIVALSTSLEVNFEKRE